MLSTRAASEPGRLRLRLVLEKPVPAPDGAGGRTLSWNATGIVAADVVPVRPEERGVGAGIADLTLHRIIIRHRTDVVPGDRFRLGARTFLILGVTDPERRAIPRLPRGRRGPAVSSAMQGLQAAVFAALTGDAALVALLGGPHVHDGAPRNAAPPYVHFGEAALRDWSTATEDGVEIGFAVVAWSRAGGRSEALGIADRVGAVLNDAGLALEGWRVVNLRHLGTETARAEKPEGHRAVARFRARLEPD